MKKFLNSVYTHHNRHEDTMALYDAWAETYDAEITENGYVTPSRCVAALALVGSDKHAPTMDVGCGTGFSGQALADGGFTCIDGTDTNASMLAQAKKRADVYRNLMLVDLDNPFPFAKGSYENISAMGVIAARHAPPETISAILDKLPSGGRVVFSLNDHTLEDARFEAEITRNIDNKTAEVVFREHGSHLRGINMGSVVYVLQKVS